jgi:cysteine desulfurase
MMIYLDNAATTKVTQPVLDVMLPYLSIHYGNPSSTHKMGKIAKIAIENARQQVAEVINAEPSQIIFTSGATESNNWVDKLNVVARSIYEHPSNRDEGFEIFDLHKYEMVSTDDIFMYGRDNSVDVVSHIWVNNETGQIYDIEPIANETHRKGLCFHTDATQAFGHIPIDVKSMPIDFLSLSGHKFHAPKGIGILYVKDFENPISPFYPFNNGGGQEHGWRSGTEDVAAIAAIGKAAELYKYSAKENQRQWEMKNYIIDYFVNNIPHTYFTLNSSAKSISNLISVAFKDVDGGDLQEMLSDIYNVYVGTGSACSSNHSEISHTIKDSKLSEDLWHSIIRISMSTETTMDEVKAAVQHIEQCVKQMRAIKG